MLELIDPAKDADGLHPTNLGRLVLGVDGELALAAAVHARRASSSCCSRYDVPIAGKHVVVIGRGLTVGRPLGLLLHPQGRRRDGHPHPLAHASTSRPRCAGPTSWSPRSASRTSCSPSGSSRARRCSTSASPASATTETGKARLHRRRRPRCRGGRRLAVAEPRRRRPDDPGDAAHERGGGGGALAGLSALRGVARTSGVARRRRRDAATVNISGCPKPCSANAPSTATCRRETSPRRDERDRGAAEAAAGHARADGAVGLRRLDGQVELGDRDLEVVAHRGVRGVEELADRGGTVRAQRAHRVEHALVLGDDVPHAAEGLVVQQLVRRASRSSTVRSRSDGTPMSAAPRSQDARRSA